MTIFKARRVHILQRTATIASSADVIRGTPCVHHVYLNAIPDMHKYAVPPSSRILLPR